MCGACAPVTYYQVYKTVPEKLTTSGDVLVYEDDNCKILYNLWSEGGNVGFVFTNKTDKTIYINKAECFFVLNGFSYDYYKNRIYSSSSSIGIASGQEGFFSSSYSYGTSRTGQRSAGEIDLLNVSAGYIKTSSASVSTTTAESASNVNIVGDFKMKSFSKASSLSFSEPPIIRVAPNSAVIVTEYDITGRRFKNCDTEKYPKKTSSVQFTKDNSPFVFFNRICYCTTSECTNPVYVTNNFYVNEIVNMTEGSFYERDYEYDCGKKSQTKVNFYNHYAPNNFFIKYN